MAFSEAIKDEVKRKAHFTCCWCRDPRSKVEIHHILPQADNGPDSVDNAAPLCGSCHQLFGNNPDLRKEIRGRRDLWYQICAAEVDDDELEDPYLGKLERLKAELEARGDDTTEVTEQILDHRRRLREGKALVAGDVLGKRYELQEVIGQGGFAVVWKAFDRTTKTVVAVKVMHAQYAKDRTRRERFFRGAKEMARLRHDGIVRVIEPKSPKGGPAYFAMEYVAGGDFHEAVVAGRLTVDQRMAIVRQVGEALAYAHDQGVIHRDVKPANVLLDLKGQPLLTDFDLVKAGDTTGGTRTGMLGSFIYAAPETMSNARKAKAPADVFGLGMTAIFALFGQDLPLHVLRDASEFLAHLDAAAPWREAIVRAVEWDLKDRYATIAEFCEALGVEDGRDESVNKESLKVSNPMLRMKWIADQLDQINPLFFGHQYTSHDDVVVDDRERFFKLEEDYGSLRVKVNAQYNIDYNPRDRKRTLEELFRWIETPKDGRMELWRKIPAGEHLVSKKWMTQQVVNLLQSFDMAVVPVTNAQYATFNSDHIFYFDEAFHPAVNINWDEAMDFCRWLSETFAWARGARLPTENEWQFACEAMGGTHYPGDSHRLRRVGEKEANGCGLYDMHGNVWEWTMTSDLPERGEVRVILGGLTPGANRRRVNPWYRSEDLGFRIVLPQADR